MLGQGGMGDVYEGFDVRLARRVALKVLNSDGLLDDEARTRLVREARTLSKLDHPNICRIYDFIDDRDADVLVLELIDGRTLHDAMRDGLSNAEKLRIARDVASVLVAAHRAGIIHRDLKPENVMLTKSGEVKVLDFGLARWLKRRSGKSDPAISPARLHVGDADSTLPAGDEPAAANATAIGSTVGTPLFMSPEQARGEPLTTASDMYSFGLLLQALFTGRDPYPDDLTARQVMIRASRGESLPVNGVRRDVAALIKSLKAFAPSDRPTAGDALRRVERIIAMPKRIAERVAAAAVLAVLIFAGWKYTTDLRRERAAAQKAEAEALRSRADADGLIGFMLGDLRTKLEPVGRLDIMNDVAARSLAYMSSLQTDSMQPKEIARNSKALNQLGEVRMAQGNLTSAAAVFNKSLSLAKLAAQRGGNDPELELGVATAHFWVGNALRLQGDLPGALVQMREYRRIAEALAKRFPGNDDYQVERAYGHSNVGTILDAQGELTGALDEYRLTLQVESARLAGSVTDPKRKDDLAQTLNKTGWVLQRLGRLAEARAHYDQEFAIYSGLAATDTKNARWKDRTANSHAYLASVLQAVGELDAALQHADAGAALYSELVARDPTNTDWQRNVASSLNRSAMLLVGKGKPRDAIEKIRVAEFNISLLLKHESRPVWQSDLGTIEATYARALVDAGDVRLGRAKAAAAVETLRNAPSAPARVVADAYIAVAEGAEAAGDSAAALAAWTEAKSRLAPAAARTSDPRVLSIYARALVAAGDAEAGRSLIARLRAAGYRGVELDRFCAKRGC
ncbi:MAG TPA: serine/threonine-protein kinase [Thermoanaerobaculia bacterium]|nr:serine/threonine-protein kinase [Thermoanaerobaculia bacterium]